MSDGQLFFDIIIAYAVLKIYLWCRATAKELERRAGK
jgi:hypothetical protein